VYKFAALRVINKIAGKQPRLVSMCQTELDTLITDQNRSVASLAISTLLKTCNEDQVGKLLKQINGYLPDLGLEFKIETIQSTALLYSRMPNKSGVLLKFLADCLKDDPNIHFRESVVNTIMEICPSQREQALLILSEHIEDCMQAQI
jgi:coatomer protein complex subunit gamma